jgi:Zn-dependent alcohol dehydrogenase
VRTHQAGQLQLDELVTKEHTLDQVAEACEDVHADRKTRGVVVSG